MSLLDRTRVGQPDHSGRQAGRCGHTRADLRPRPWVRDIYRKYVECRKYSHGEGIINAELNKNVVPNVTHGE